MALTNYSDLQTAVSNYSHRTVSQVTDFISIAEKRINRRLESRMAEVDASLTATIGNRYMALPSGFIHHYYLWFTTYNPDTEVVYIQSDRLPVKDTNSQPQYFTINGSNIAFDCPADLAYTYTLRYKKGYDLASTTTNDIMTNHPDVYLYGSLLEAAVFARDKDIIQYYGDRFEQALTECSVSEGANTGDGIVLIDGPVSRSNIISGDL